MTDERIGEEVAPREVDLVIQHGLIVAVDSGRRILDPGAIAVADGRIEAIGPDAEVTSRYRGREVIDASGHLVMPGLVDSHSHLSQGQRGLIPDSVDSTAFLMQWSLPMFAALTPEEEHLFTRLVCAEHLKTGTTTVVEGGTLRHLDAAVAAIEEVGLRANIGRLTWDNPMLWDVVNPRLASARMTTDEALGGCEEAIDRWHGAVGGRVSVWVHLVGGGSATPALLQGAKRIADERGLGVSQHEATDAAQVRRVQESTGLRPVELLAELGVLGRNMRLVHANALADHEVVLIAETGTKVVTAPTGAWRLALGMAQTGKVPELLDGGAVVALASDSCNASNTADMVRVMHVAAGVWRDIRADPEAVSVTEAIEMATLNGARSLLMEDHIGSLEVGKRADIALFDTNRVEWAPMIDPLMNLVFSATGDSVDTVIVDGEIVLRHGKPTRFDEDALLAELRAIDWDERLEAWTGFRRPRCPWPLA